MKKRFVSVGLVCALVVGAWFVLAFRPAQSKLGDLRADVDTTKQEVAELEAQLERLLQLQRNETEVREEAGRMATALPADAKVSDLIIQIQDAANAAGIDFLTITPSLPAVPPEAAPPAPAPASEDGVAATPAPTAGPATGAAAAAQTEPDPVSRLRSIDVQIKADGQFFAIEQFVLRLEQLSRAMRIDDFSLTAASQEAGTPRLSAGLTVRVFMLAPQAAAGTTTPQATQGTAGAA